MRIAVQNQIHLSFLGAKRVYHYKQLSPNLTLAHCGCNSVRLSAFQAIARYVLWMMVG
ncbi:hypothetical protein H6G97_05950 [Nostoc flagelliforme FACHB-838]|uniref:Transposase n=1 Tax=Nostoc flagelliforme FACHB-838 TaxID=2692904 RepID=A0ABR8DIC3_9NOSO|nr:hypothetical protein [Nostoc flagelliforme FACHB-838]